MPLWLVLSSRLKANPISLSNLIRNPRVIGLIGVTSASRSDRCDL